VQVDAEHIAIVTGAGSGVGRASAVALAERGFTTILTGRRAAALEETAAIVGATGSGRSRVVPCDVGSTIEVAALVEQVLEKFGRVDVLVNAAGGNIRNRALTELQVDDWERLLDVNLNGCYRFVHAVLPVMRRQGGGTFVHIGSYSAHRPGAYAGAAYTASKAGLAALSATINAEEGNHGIRSTVITLGEVDTAILDQRPRPPSAEARALLLLPQDVADCVAAIVALPPRATVEEIVLVPTRRA
jgi:NADP-dependent 3-hydroxy acid dehydrogenase YdfG